MNPLKQVEREVLRRSREWARAELEKCLQRQADEVEMVCPKSGERLSNTRYRRMILRTVPGVVKLRVRIGYSQKKRAWVNPVRNAWGLVPYQQVSPELQARVCQTASLATSYESAAELAACWDCELSDDLVHRHVQQAGAKVKQLATLPRDSLPKQDFSLVIMMDGWMARERGPDWGVSRRKETKNRIAWHEIKSAVIYRLEQSVATGKNRRGLLLEKYIVATPPETDPAEFGEAVQTEALRRGLGKAKRVYIVIDGAVWLWHLARDRFKEAILILDFHHAREHLMAVGQAVFGEDATAVRQWVDPLIRQLQKGKEQCVVATLEELLANCTNLSSPQFKTIEREVSYFQDHRDHLHYQRWKRSGAPCGSGAVESLGRQLQRRFRTCGQFWQRPGLTNLLGLTVLFRNHDHGQIWN